MATAERGRVLVAIDTGSLTRPVLDAATALAVAQRALLAALFVEDERLLRLASLPFAQEIGFPSAAVRRIGVADMERAFRAQAEQLRRTIEHAAQSYAISWTLEIVRGEIVSASLARLQPGDVLVTGKGRRGDFTLGEAPRRGGRFATLAARPVTILLEDLDAGEHALETAMALASVLSAGLAVLIPAADTTAFRAQRARVLEWLAAHGITARCFAVEPRDSEAMANAVRAADAATLVLAASAIDLDPRALGALLERLACPVVLLP